MIAEVANREGESYLPEQYYLAERLTGWRHIATKWNWEVWPEWDDPGYTHPTMSAHRDAKRFGWAGYDLDGWSDEMEGPPDAQTVLKNVCVWHFSGSSDTAPWLFQSAADANGVRERATKRFKHRDPGGVVATAVYEWRTALDALLAEESPVKKPLAAAAESLRIAAIDLLSREWWCDKCCDRRYCVRKVKDLPFDGKHCTVAWDGMRWLCADCIIEHVRLVGGEEQCKCGQYGPELWKSVEWKCGTPWRSAAGPRSCSSTWGRPCTNT